MKNKILFYIVIGLLTFCLYGCSTTKGTRTDTKVYKDANGNVVTNTSQLTISNNRFFWTSEGIDANVNEGGTNGFKFGLKVNKSNVDAAAITAVGDAVIKGIAAGKP